MTFDEWWKKEADPQGQWVGDYSTDARTNAELGWDAAMRLMRPEEVSRWIPCSVRLPEISGWCMAWFQGSHAILHFDNQTGWYWGDGEHVMDEPYVSHITHWQELPDAPTPQKD